MYKLRFELLNVVVGSELFTVVVAEAVFADVGVVFLLLSLLLIVVFFSDVK